MSTPEQTNPLERRRILVERFDSPRPALFLDRDGVLIEEKHYLCDPEQVNLYPGAEPLLKLATNEGWPTIVITNQSGISRGYFTWSEYEKVTDQILRALKTDTSLAAIYANGHGPDASEANWRKPRPGMLLEAAKELNLDLRRSVLVGDRLSDLIAGQRAGISNLCHVKTGHGEKERSSVEAWSSENAAQQRERYSHETFLFDSLDQVASALKGWMQ